MEIFAWFALWTMYFVLWIGLFVINFMIFNYLAWYNVKRHIIDEQNKALAKIVKWQVIWQGIMIWSLIYFLWTTIDKVYSTAWLNIQALLSNINSIFMFGMVWIIVFQLTIYIIWKILPLKKEIIIDQNESLASIIEWLLIAISIILSLSLYAY